MGVGDWIAWGVGVATIGILFRPAFSWVESVAQGE